MHVKGNDETFLIHLQSVEIPCCTPIHLSGGSGVVAAGGLQTGGRQLIVGRRRVRWQGLSSPTPTSRPPSSGKKRLRPPSSRHPPSAVLLATVLDSVPPYPCDLGSSRASTSTQQRVRYAASLICSSLPPPRNLP
jgi:hypothetical protein